MQATRPVCGHPPVAVARKPRRREDADEGRRPPGNSQAGDLRQLKKTSPDENTGRADGLIGRGSRPSGREGQGAGGGSRGASGGSHPPSGDQPGSEDAAGHGHVRVSKQRPTESIGRRVRLFGQTRQRRLTSPSGGDNNAAAAAVQAAETHSLTHRHTTRKVGGRTDTRTRTTHTARNGGTGGETLGGARTPTPRRRHTHWDGRSHRHTHTPTRRRRRRCRVAVAVSVKARRRWEARFCGLCLSALCVSLSRSLSLCLSRRRHGAQRKPRLRAQPTVTAFDLAVMTLR